MTSEVPLAEQLEHYAKIYPNEFPTIQNFLKLLEHKDAFERTHLPGHITGSVFIVSEDRSKTLLVHHAKLNRWLQPGGHADGDTDVIHVALREGNEETGLQHLELVSAEIFDLDIHPIPTRKDFPQHDHYDVRYLVRASTSEPIVVSEESHDVQWIDLKELEKYSVEKSVLRLRTKLSDSASLDRNQKKA